MIYLREFDFLSVRANDLLNVKESCYTSFYPYSPFILSIKEAKIYDFDENPVRTRPWTELKNVRDYYNFFKEHEAEFEN